MDLSKVVLPNWLMPFLQSLMLTAEDTFGPRTGPQKKEWVRNALLDAAGRVDMANVPDWLETPIKTALVDILIEAVWALLFADGPRPRMRAGLARMGGAGVRPLTRSDEAALRAQGLG